MTRPADSVLVAVITAAHGIRGQVKIRSFADTPEAIFSYPLTDKSGKPFGLKRHGAQQQLFIAAIDGISDRNAAELLRGTELYAPASALPPRKENQWYHTELVGMEARVSTGKAYGVVVQVHNFGAGDIIELKRPDGSMEMLPFRKPFVGNVHTDKGYMEVSPPEYIEGEEEA